MGEAPRQAATRRKSRFRDGIDEDPRRGALQVTEPVSDRAKKGTRARAEAGRYAGEAIESLSIFPPSLYRQALLSVPRFIIEREM